MMSILDRDPQVRRIRLEMRVQDRAVSALRGTIQPRRARRACHLFRKARPSADTLEDLVVDAALALIDQAPVPLVEAECTCGGTWDGFMYEVISYVWLRWAGGDTSTVQDLIPRLLSDTDEQHRIGLHGSSLHVLALSCWAHGVEHLTRGNKIEARVHFERALEAGDIIGTPSNGVIAWTYAASFFPHDKAHSQRPSSSVVDITAFLRDAS